MPKRRTTLDPELAAEAQSMVALAFRNGPIEDVHAGDSSIQAAAMLTLVAEPLRGHHPVGGASFPDENH